MAKHEVSESLHSTLAARGEREKSKVMIVSGSQAGAKESCNNLYPITDNLKYPPFLFDTGFTGLIENLPVLDGFLRH